MRLGLVQRTTGESPPGERIVQDLPARVLEQAALAGMLLVGALLLGRGAGAPGAITVLALYATAAFRMLPAFNRITMAVSSIRFSWTAVQTVTEDLMRQRSLAAASERPGRETLEDSRRAQGGFVTASKFRR